MTENNRNPQPHQQDQKGHAPDPREERHAQGREDQQRENPQREQQR